MAFPEMGRGARRGSFNDRWQDSYRGGADQARSPSEGSFRGRGPKDYRRSDERIREDACERLTDDDWLDASNIEVSVSGGEVTLSGGVNSRQEKRRAEDLIASVSGVRDVRNQLRVVNEGGLIEGPAQSGQATRRS